MSLLSFASLRVLLVNSIVLPPGAQPFQRLAARAVTWLQTQRSLKMGNCLPLSPRLARQQSAKIEMRLRLQRRRRFQRQQHLELPDGLG